jgi:UDP:flavonoid glycosyltransferase YjiC (YdhE family)
MAHERYNTEWVEQLGAGIVIGDFAREIEGAVRQLLDPERYRRFREGAASCSNHAVYEIPAMLARILGENYANLGSGEKYKTAALR